MVSVASVQTHRRGALLLLAAGVAGLGSLRVPVRGFASGAAQRLRIVFRLPLMAANGAYPNGDRSFLAWHTPRVYTQVCRCQAHCGDFRILDGATMEAITQSPRRALTACEWQHSGNTVAHSGSREMPTPVPEIQRPKQLSSISQCSGFCSWGLFLSACICLWQETESG